MQLQKAKENEPAELTTDAALTRKTTEILRKIEIEIKKFISHQETRQLITKIKALLEDKKMITKKDILEQEEIKQLLLKTEKEFKELYNTIKNLLM